MQKGGSILDPDTAKPSADYLMPRLLTEFIPGWAVPVVPMVSLLARERVPLATAEAE